MDRLGAQLGKAVDAFNDTVSSMESRVMVTARRLHDLEMAEQEVPAIHRVDSLPRAVSFADADDQPLRPPCRNTAERAGS
ncbi:hypothetical protein ACW2Q0_08695 [Nocardia sp. R16R-3T]